MFFQTSYNKPAFGFLIQNIQLRHIWRDSKSKKSTNKFVIKFLPSVLKKATINFKLAFCRKTKQIPLQRI